MVQCGLADVDGYYLRGTVGERINRRLVGAATRDENIKIRFVIPVRS